MKAKQQLERKYRFMEGETRTAVLDTDGKLSHFDNGMTVYASWRDFVKEIMQDDPVKGDEAEIIEQLGMFLGDPQPIEEAANVTSVAQAKAKQKEEKEANEMKNATKAAPVATKKAAPKVKAEVVQNPCICGCGTMVNKNFAPGHDSRVHGWGKKIADGRMKFGEIPAIAQKFLKDHGIKQGTAAKV